MNDFERRVEELRERRATLVAELTRAWHAEQRKIGDLRRKRAVLIKNGGATDSRSTREIVDENRSASFYQLGTSRRVESAHFASNLNINVTCVDFFGCLGVIENFSGCFCQK